MRKSTWLEFTRWRVSAKLCVAISRETICRYFARNIVSRDRLLPSRFREGEAPAEPLPGGRGSCRAARALALLSAMLPQDVGRIDRARLSRFPPGAPRSTWHPDQAVAPPVHHEDLTGYERSLVRSEEKRQRSRNQVLLNSRSSTRSVSRSPPFQLCGLAPLRELVLHFLELNLRAERRFQNCLSFRTKDFVLCCRRPRCVTPAANRTHSFGSC